MINPPLPPTIPKPHITDIGMQPQMFSPPATKETPTNMASPLLPSKVQNTFNAYLILIGFMMFPVFEILVHGVFDQRNNKSQQEDNLLNEDRQI